MRYERLVDEARPVTGDVAFLYHDDGNPVRDHFVCYCVDNSRRPRRYVIASMACEDTDFYDYRGPAPARRGLQIYSVYRVHGSEHTNGYDQHHIVICFADKSIEFTGLSFGISVPLEGTNAAAVLAAHVLRSFGAEPRAARGT
jgi:hypothetical protein